MYMITIILGIIIFNDNRWPLDTVIMWISDSRFSMACPGKPKISQTSLLYFIKHIIRKKFGEPMYVKADQLQKLTLFACSHFSVPQTRRMFDHCLPAGSRNDIFWRFGIN